MAYQKLTKISASIQSSVQNMVSDNYPLQDIITAIDACKGRILLVGGAVRDLMLGLPVKDLDCEVHGISLDSLQEILKRFGPVSLVGKSFGVLRLHSLDIDFSVPRTDSAGRKPQVDLDTQLTFEQAFRRRDLTMNAMGIDLVTFELIDPFDGQKDIAERRLRTPDARLFVEDPLRFFRVMQFIGRFNMVPDDQLNSLCASMSLANISRERIEGEFEKLFLRSMRPSLGLRWLHQIGRLKQILPELAATVGVEQSPEWHPEGDVFEHTMQAVDAAARFSYQEVPRKLIIMYAVLCHDIGKPDTTQIVDGVIRSYEHAQVGARLAKKMLVRITVNKELIDTVVKLVDAHMLPGQFVSQNASLAAYKRLARKLAPQTNLYELSLVARADKLGRNKASHEPLDIPLADVTKFMQKAEHANVVYKPQEPILQGRDLCNDY